MITKLGRRVAHVVTMCGVAPEHLTKYFWWQLTKYSALPVKNTRGCPWKGFHLLKCAQHASARQLTARRHILIRGTALQWRVFLLAGTYSAFNAGVCHNRGGLTHLGERDRGGSCYIERFEHHRVTKVPVVSIRAWVNILLQPILYHSPHLDEIFHDGHRFISWNVFKCQITQFHPLWQLWIMLIFGHAMKGQWWWGWTQLCQYYANPRTTDSARTPNCNLQSAQTMFNCTAQDSSLLYSIAHPNINLVIMLKVLGSQWSANDSCILSHLYFQFYLWVVLKHVQNIKKNSYSPVGLVWPNTEELISRPFSGLYKIRMRTKNLRN